VATPTNRSLLTQYARHPAGQGLVPHAKRLLDSRAGPLLVVAAGAGLLAALAVLAAAVRTAWRPIRGCARPGTFLGSGRVSVGSLYTTLPEDPSVVVEEDH
jgi:hypothetical protein